MQQQLLNMYEQYNTVLYIRVQYTVTGRIENTSPMRAHALFVDIFELVAAVWNRRQSERVVNGAPLLRMCGGLVPAAVAHSLEEPVHVEIDAGETGRRIHWRALKMASDK